MAELDWSEMPIHQAIKSDWATPEILIEGSLNCAKTTVFLDKEIDALMKWPGIPILLFRWTEDAVETKLRPAFEDLLSIRGISATWEAKKKRFEIENGSLCYMFGLKSASVLEQFNKIRGLGVSRIGGDQIEEMSPAVAAELRGRLRPDLKATMNQTRFPFQLTFVANPEDGDFWLSKEFPADNRIKGRRLYSLSIFDNKHLPQESVDSLLRQYPPEHPKHVTMVLGQRGPNITGTPVFEGLYKKEFHRRPIDFRMDAPILESFHFGKHNPTWVFGQQTYDGSMHWLGGIRGQELMLEDFLPIVRAHREQWYPAHLAIKSCTAPLGQKTSENAVGLLRQAGFTVSHRDHGNSPDVRLALIERIAGQLRRRAPSGDEALGVNDAADRWLIASRSEIKDSAFLHIAFEAGYTWDTHFVSVANKEVRQPREDDKFANAMHCVENIVYNFCYHLSKSERDAKRALIRGASGGSSGPPPGGSNSWLGA